MAVGKVFVNNIVCKAFVGINPGEQLYSQKIEFGFEFEYDWDAVIASDLIENAVDYSILTEELRAFVSQSKFSILECLVFEMAKKVLKFSNKVKKAKVYCKKINALPGTSGAGAEIELRAEN